MFSFFFAFLLYSKILYYSIRNKSRNLVQIFVNFNQLKCKIAQYSIFRLKKQNQNSKFSLNSGSVFSKILFSTVPQFHPASALQDLQEQLLSHLQGLFGLPQAAVQPLQRHSLRLPALPHHPQVSDNW